MQIQNFNYATNNKCFRLLFITNSKHLLLILFLNSIFIFCNNKKRDRQTDSLFTIFSLILLYYPRIILF